jgi:hypothetical protein
LRPLQLARQTVQHACAGGKIPRIHAREKFPPQAGHDCLPPAQRLVGRRLGLHNLGAAIATARAALDAVLSLQCVHQAHDGRLLDAEAAGELALDQAIRRPGNLLEGREASIGLADYFQAIVKPRPPPATHEH